MPRISRIQGLASLSRAVSCSAAPARASFAQSRHFTSTPVAHDVRSKLWKDGAPGAADPYTEAPEEAVDEPISFTDEGHVDKRPGAVRRTRIAMPYQRTEAPTEGEVSTTVPDYTPATSIDELDEIQPLHKWFDQPGNWGEESEFKGFAPKDKIIDREVVEVYLRRAVVEMLALRRAGKLGEAVTRKWPEGSSESLREVLSHQVSVSNGVGSLDGDVTVLTEQLKPTDAEGAEPAGPGARVSTEEAKEMLKAWDNSWKDIQLDNEAKFAIRKRLYQLTGTLIPDARLGAAHTVKHMLTFGVKQPKPEKLADLFAANDVFANLPNVRRSDKKVGAIDREKEVGRWKVIEEELTKRGLPVTGTAGLSGNKESRWIRGAE